jgi:hypothetical protein
VSDREWERQFLSEHSTLTVPLVDRLAIEYHMHCEEFDRKVCSGKDRDGDARPANGHELREVQMHAEQVIRALLGQNRDVPEARLRMRINHFGKHYTTEGLLRLAAAIAEQEGT